MCYWEQSHQLMMVEIESHILASLALCIKFKALYMSDDIGRLDFSRGFILCKINKLNYSQAAR